MKIESFQEFQKALADEPVTEPNCLLAKKAILDKIAALENIPEKRKIPKKAVLVCVIIAMLTFPFYIVAKNVISGIIELKGSKGDTLVKYIPRDEQWFEENKKEANTKDELRKMYADRIEEFKKQVGENQIGYLIIPLESGYFMDTVQSNVFRNYHDLDIFMNDISQHKELPFVLPHNIPKGFEFIHGTTRNDNPSAPYQQLYDYAVKNNMEQIIWTADIYDELVSATAEFSNDRYLVSLSIWDMGLFLSTESVTEGTEYEEIEHNGLKIHHFLQQYSDQYDFIFTVQGCDFKYQISMKPGALTKDQVINMIDSIVTQIDEDRDNYVIEYNRLRDGLDYWLKRAQYDYITEIAVESIIPVEDKIQDYSDEIERIRNTYAEQIKTAKYASEIRLTNDNGAGIITPISDSDGRITAFYKLHTSKPDVYESFDEFQKRLADLEFNMPIPRNIRSGFSFRKASIMYRYRGITSLERCLEIAKSLGLQGLNTYRLEKVYSAKQEYGTDKGESIYFGVFIEEHYIESHKSDSIKVGDCEVKIYETDIGIIYQFKIIAGEEDLTYQIVCPETMDRNQAVEMIRDLLEQ